MTGEQPLAAGYGSDDEEGLCGGEDGLGQGLVGRVVGEVLLAGEEADEGSAIAGGLIAESAAEGGEAEFESVKKRALGDGHGDVKEDFAAGAGEGLEVGGELDADLDGGRRRELVSFGHGRVWASTERTGGRSRTMAFQELPASEEA